MKKITTIDEYIEAQPAEVAQRLATIRTLFHDIIPATQESIRYQIMAFTVGRDHLYISGYKNHIGMYPVYGLPELEEDVLPYRGEGTKNALHFKHKEPLPLELIEKIIRAKDNLSA